MYVGTQTGFIDKVDTITKIPTEVINLNSRIYSLVIKGDDLYAGTYDGKVYKIEF